MSEPTRGRRKHRRITALASLLFLCALGAAFILYPRSLDDKLFGIAYGLDPQRPSHSYFMDGRQLPLEARKVGMFGGFLITYLALLLSGLGRAASFPPPRALVLLLGFVALMGVDGLNATFYDLGWPHAYTPSLRLRLATGLLAGLAMAALLLPAVNGSLWREIRHVAPLSTTGQLVGAFLLCIGLFVLVDARLSILYYPVGVFAVVGLVTELTLINMVFVLALTRHVGMAESLWDVTPVLVAAFALSVCELAIMSGIRSVTLGDLTRTM